MIGVRWFEYHCWESLDSSDASIWVRSHERVSVLRMTQPGYGSTFDERSTNGEPRMFRVLFSDGLEWDVFEDEIMHSSPLDFCRPSPISKVLARPAT